jgi:diacylglycerol O-acyltransferase
VEQLSGQDARFLHFESPTLHMHTLKVAVLDPAAGRGRYSFELLRAELASRLDLLVPFRRRLLPAPLGLTHPFWVEDPDFDLERHLVRRAAPPPGDRAALESVVSEIAGRPLPRDRPLWEITVVEGLAGGRVACVAKIHHAVADGKAAVDLLGHVLADRAPSSAAAVTPWAPDRIPTTAERLWLVARSWARLARALPRLSVRTLRGFVRRVRVGRRASPKPPRPIVDPPRTPFNQSLTAEREFATLDLPLDALRAVRARCGVSLNDVLLGIVAGALRSVLLELHALPARPLVAGVPIGASLGDSTRLWGNAVDNMFATLATDVADPVERLQRIAAVTRVSKQARAAMGSEVVVEWQGYTPAPLFAWITHLAARHGVFDRMPPMINCIVSNVAGPRERLHAGGVPLEAIYSVGPILEGVGLNVTAWSYCDTMHVALLSCPTTGPAVTRVRDAMRGECDELAARAA